MSHAMVIATRELRERSRLFLLCAAMAVLPFLISLMPAAKNDRPLVIATFGGGIATVMALSIAVATGTSTIGGDLASRRLSYYFAKPISPAALWIGKAGSALFTCVAAFAIIAVPAFLAGGTMQFRSWGGTTLLGIVAGLTFVLFFVSHVVGTMVRSKSALIGVDFALAAVAVFVLFLILRPLLLSAGDLMVAIFVSLGIGVLLIFAIAPVWQLANGRTDLRRSHAALSRAIWIAVAALLLVVAGVVAWIVSMGPNDITHVGGLDQATGANTFLVTGQNKYRGDYQGAYLVNGDSGKYERLDSPAWWGVRYSRDGRVAAWLRPHTLMPSSRLELHTRRLDDPSAKTVATNIRTTGFPFFTLSDDGTRLAIADNTAVSVYEVATQRLLTAVRIPFARTDLRGLFFISPDVVRVIEYKSVRNEVPVRIYELNVPARKIVQTGAMHAQMGYGAIAVSHDGSRLLFRHAKAIGDGRTGALITKLPVEGVRPFAMAMLNDGRVAALTKGEGGGMRLHLLSRDGQPIREFVLPAIEHAMISAQIGDDKLLVNSSNIVTGPKRQWKMHVIDLNRGAVERTLNDVRGPMPAWFDPRLTRFTPNQKVGGVAGESAGEGRVVVIDLRSGTHSALPS